MGVNQSTEFRSSNRPEHGGEDSATGKTCYYEILGVARQATEDEIKRAYRRKALDLHPDRNYGNAEATTAQFARLQSAYEVLSDPQERVWYDSHRDAILWDEEGITSDHYEHSVRFTTAEDILRMFRKFNGPLDFTESDTGFYGTLREIFNVLASEEQAACERDGSKPVYYPSFGCASDNYEENVRSFYAFWTYFSTQKDFSWKNVYKYSEAPDRRVRRLMEKENKRFRDEGIRQFNDAVQSLVAFVKKRDPRVKFNQQSEVERQRILRDAASAQAARSRAANTVKATQSGAIPEWMRSSELPECRTSDEDVSDAPREEFECIVCRKNFKSEKQYGAHEKSRKHLKVIKHIRKQMQRDNVQFDLDGLTHSNVAEVAQEEFKESYDVSADIVEKNVSGDFAELLKESKASSKEAELDQPSSDEGSALLAADSFGCRSGAGYVSDEGLEERLSGSNPKCELRSSAEEDEVCSAVEPISLQGSASEHKPKIGKAKEKRAKKAAQKSIANSGRPLDLKCATCQVSFPSKTKLFNHIKDLEHAQLRPKKERGKER